MVKVLFLQSMFNMVDEQTETLIRDRVNNKPVAFAASIMDKINDLVILLGAGTLPEYRGKGIYSSLVARRLEDAKNIGMHAAIIQAVKHTSAPICEKLGFRTVCEIDFYIYSP